MIIRLLDITEDGEDFDYKKGDESDLDQQFTEVLGFLPDYSVECHIQALGNVYSAQGQIQTTAKDTCSLCGEDLELPLAFKFNEYLIKNDDREADGHAPHTGLDIDSASEATFFDSYDFDLGDFLREQLVIAIPNYPKCPANQGCEERQVEIQKKLDQVGLQGHPAFAVLKDLKKH